MPFENYTIYSKRIYILAHKKNFFTNIYKNAL
jgi:hypothetical protein